MPLPQAVHEVCKALLKVYARKLLHGNGPITTERPDDITLSHPAREVRSELVRAFLQDKATSDTVHSRACAIQVGTAHQQCHMSII